MGWTSSVEIRGDPWRSLQPFCDVALALCRDLKVPGPGLYPEAKVLDPPKADPLSDLLGVGRVPAGPFIFILGSDLRTAAASGGSAPVWASEELVTFFLPKRAGPVKISGNQWKTVFPKAK